MLPGGRPLIQYTGRSDVVAAIAASVVIASRDGGRSFQALSTEGEAIPGRWPSPGPLDLSKASWPPAWPGDVGGGSDRMPCMRLWVAAVLVVVAAAVGRWTALGDQTDQGAGVTTTTTTRPAFTGSRETASHALERMLNNAEVGSFEQLWLDLDPAQQAVIPRDRFVACETATWQRLLESGSRYVVTSPPEELRDPHPVYGTDVTRHRAVLVQMGIESDSAGSAHRTAFLGAVDGRWRWIMGRGEVDAYVAGNCPSFGLPSFY